MVEKTMENEIAQLQMLEQNLESIEMQKQNFQLQLVESENSLKEIENYEGKPYKIIGPVMIETEKDDLVKDLSEKIELLKSRSESMEKQEKSFREQFETIQKKLMEEMQKQNPNK